MDIFEQFMAEVRDIVREEIQLIPKHAEEKWMNTKKLCEYLGFNRSWVSHRLDKLPHIKDSLRFRKSEVDKWLNLQIQNEIEEQHVDTNVKVSSKKKKYKIV